MTARESRIRAFACVYGIPLGSVHDSCDWWGNRSEKIFASPPCQTFRKGVERLCRREGNNKRNAPPPFASTILRLFSTFDKVVCKIFFRGIVCSSSHYPCGAPQLKKTTCSTLHGCCVRMVHIASYLKCYHLRRLQGVIPFEPHWWSKLYQKNAHGALLTSSVSHVHFFD